MAGTFLGARRGMSGSFGTTSDSITIVALVRMDDPHDGALQAINTPGIPAQGSYYDWQNEVRFDLILNSANAKQDPKAPRYWEIELTYESIPSNSDGGNGGMPGIDPAIPEHRENPLARPAEVTQGFRVEQRVADKCFDYTFGSMAGLKTPVADDAIDDATARTYKAVTNSAKERYTDPPLMEDFEIQTWSIVKNISPSDKVAIESGGYAGSLNQDEFTIDGVTFKIAEGRLLGITFRRIRERNTLYYQASFTLERNPETWLRSIMDRGPRDKNGASPTGADFNTGGAWNLDNSGLFLAANATPQFNYYRTKRFRPFNNLQNFWS